MKNGIVIFVAGAVLVGALGIALYRLGYRVCRTSVAESAATAIKDNSEGSARARAVVDSADDCAVKRMLCADALGGCDPARVCGAPDGGGDNADGAAVDGKLAPDSAQ